MSAGALVCEQPACSTLEQLEGQLLVAFEAARDALAAERAVVVVVRERDLLGHGDPIEAALAHALVGLVRALATEGARAGWTLNALAVAEDTPAAEREVWVRRLGEPEGGAGLVVRLGRDHLGRVGV